MANGNQKPGFFDTDRGKHAVRLFSAYAAREMGLARAPSTGTGSSSPSPGFIPGSQLDAADVDLSLAQYKAPPELPRVITWAFDARRFDASCTAEYTMPDGSLLTMPASETPPVQAVSVVFSHGEERWVEPDWTLYEAPADLDRGLSLLYPRSKTVRGRFIRAAVIEFAAFMARMRGL